MKRNNLIRVGVVLMVAGMPAVIASVPKTNQISNDAALYQNLHEIRISRERSVDFDSDIQRLSAQEKSHRRALPLRVSAPMDRVLKTPYKPSRSLESRMSGVKKGSARRVHTGSDQ